MIKVSSSSSSSSDKKKKWWIHSFAHGEHFSHHYSSWTKKVIGLSYLLFMFGGLAFLIVATVLAFVGCSHYLMLYYLTYWNLLFVLTSWTLSTSVQCRIRYYYYKNFWYADELLDEIISEPSSPPWYIAFTRIIYVIAFTLTIIVFCLYTMIAIVDKSQVTIDVVSVMVHFCAPVLMFIQFWLSGIPLYVTDTFFVPVFVNIYITFTAAHHRFRLGRWAHPNLACSVSHDLVIKSLREDPNKQAFVYSQYVFNSWEVFVLNGFAVLGVIPILILLLIHLKQYIYKRLLAPRKPNYEFFQRSNIEVPSR